MKIPHEISPPRFIIVKRDPSFQLAISRKFQLKYSCPHFPSCRRDDKGFYGFKCRGKVGLKTAIQHLCNQRPHMVYRVKETPISIRKLFTLLSFLFFFFFSFLALYEYPQPVVFPLCYSHWSRELQIRVGQTIPTKLYRMLAKFGQKARPSTLQG